MAGADVPDRRLVPPADGWPAEQVIWVVRRLAALVVSLHAEGRRLGPVRAWDLAVRGDAVELAVDAAAEGSTADDAARVARLARSMLGVHPPTYLLSRVLAAAPAAGAGCEAAAAWLGCFAGLGPGEPPELGALADVPPVLPEQGGAAESPHAGTDVVRGLRARTARSGARFAGSAAIRHGLRGPGRVLLASVGALAFVGVLAGAALVGARSAGSGSTTDAPDAVSEIRPAPASAPSTARSPGGTDWTAVLGSLDAARDRAFRAGDADALGSVYVPGSPPDLADRSSLAGLVAHGLHAVGLRLEIQRVTVLSASDAAVRLQVVDRLPGYTIVDASESVVAREQGRGEATWTVELASTAQGWRIAAITAAQ